MKFCTLCGEDKRLVKHHISYENNIVIEVCDSCHKVIHNLLDYKKSLKDKQKIELMECYLCHHKWYYKGNNPYFRSCPNCMRKISMLKLDRIKRYKAREVAKNLLNIK